MTEVAEQLWRFARGDLPTAEFEPWAHTAPGLEEFLGPERYLHLIEVDFRNGHRVHDLREAVRGWLDRLVPRACDCPVWKSDQRIPLGYDTPPDVFLARFEVLKSRTPWLDLVRCRACGQAWYLAVDTRDDDYYLSRLSEADVREILQHDVWPSTFDKLEAVWPQAEHPR